MVEPGRERETVVVDGDRHSSYGWLIALIVIVVLVVLFFAFGGMNLFSGANGSNGGGNTVNVDTPKTVEVKPSN